MTSLLKRNLHQMVDYAESDKVIAACIGREDVCRFVLHSFMDYMTDQGLYDSSFQVLIDWSQQLNVYVDDKEWKVTKDTNMKNKDNNNDNNDNKIHIHKHSNSLKRRKKSSKKKILTPSNSLPVTPISDCTPNIPNYNSNNSYNFNENNDENEDEKLQSPKVKSIVPINNKMASLTITQTRWIDENETESDHESDDNNRYKTAKLIFLNDPRGSLQSNHHQYQYKRRWTNESELSEWNLTHQRKWSVGSWSVEDNNNNNNNYNNNNDNKRKNSISIGDHDKNLIVAKHAKNILNNIDEDEKYSYNSSYNNIYNDNIKSMTESSSLLSPINYISKLSHSTWMLIAIFLDSSSKARGLGLVSREMNLLCNHPLCWKKLKIKIDNLTKVSLNVMRRLFKYLTRFELNWNNPETPLSLLYGNDNNIININNHLNNRINGYMALKYSKEIELFFKNLSLVCNDSLHTFKLSMHGGPYRLANSAPTSVKIFQTETLLRLVFSNFSNLRKFKMDAYNLIACDVFISLLKKYSPNLQFFESQIVVYNRQTQRVILENPVILNDINILPSTLKHLCLPLLADDSWIINQHLPNLEYLFFFGYTRSSGYALHENFLSIRCLDYIAGQKSQFPNCPKIKIIEIALRQNDYLPIILRPIIRKLFLRCQYLQNVKLATAGNLDLAQSLYSSLYASNLQVCHVFAKDEGRPEKPIGVVEFRRNHNYYNNNNHNNNNNNHNNHRHLSVPYENEETISEMAIGGRLRG